MSNEFLSTEQEFDVSDAGVPTLVDATVTITGFEVEEKENGVQHVLTFAAEGLSFPVTKGYWYSHTNPKAASAGRGQLKRIARAATGSTAYSASSLVGRQILANVGENDGGFAEISKIRELPSV